MCNSPVGGYKSTNLSRRLFDDVVFPEDNLSVQSSYGGSNQIYNEVPEEAHRDEGHSVEA